MRRLFIGILAVLILLSCCACGDKGRDNDGVVTVRVHNKVSDKITSFAVSWSIDDNTVGTTCVEAAEDGGCLGDDDISFPIHAEDVKSETDLQKLKLTIQVTEKDGGTFDVARISLPSKYGDEYQLELRFEDGSYSVWQVYNNGTNARLVD